MIRKSVRTFRQRDMGNLPKLLTCDHDDAVLAIPDKDADEDDHQRLPITDNNVRAHTNTRIGTYLASLGPMNIVQDLHSSTVT